MTEYEALNDIYTQLGGASWTSPYNGNWVTADAQTNICSFYGIECNGNNEVVALRLMGIGLIGELPEIALLSLQKLNTLNISNNQVGGTIPELIGTYLTDLFYLNFSR